MREHRNLLKGHHTELRGVPLHSAQDADLHARARLLPPYNRDEPAGARARRARQRGRQPASTGKAPEPLTVAGVTTRALRPQDSRRPKALRSASSPERSAPAHSGALLWSGHSPAKDCPPCAASPPVRRPCALRQCLRLLPRRPQPSDASGGLKDALGQGARIAVQQLGKPGGFASDPGGAHRAAGQPRQGGAHHEDDGHGRADRAARSEHEHRGRSGRAAGPGLLLEAVQKMTIRRRQGHSRRRPGRRHPVPVAQQPRADPRPLPAHRQAGHRPGRPGAAVQRPLRRQGRHLRRPRRQRQHRELCHRAGPRRPVPGHRRAGGKHPRKSGWCRHQPGEEGVRRSVKQARGAFTFSSHPRGQHPSPAEGTATP